MARKSRIKTPIAEQAPTIRKSNFEEVCLGYTLAEGQEEAVRCLQCKNAPCIAKCPVMIDIPGFILAIREGNMEQAADILSKYTNLPAICGRVCPQEKQCEQVCKLGKAKNFEPVAIGKLERLVADWALENHMFPKKTAEPTKGKVAVVGSGPSGLTVAGDLAKLGYEVIIFEALHEAGGVLTYGIPEFRLPKKIVKQEIASIEALGVTIETNVVVGKTITMEEIMSEFDACYLSVGAGAPNFMGIPGTSLNGVYSSSEFLTRINLMHSYEFPEYDTPIKRAKNVVVIGGGNVAMDAARCAKRLGAEEVYIVYRRSEEELPARKEEVEHAKEEGIIFKLLNNPVEILGNEDEFVTGMKCIKMELGEPDASGRRRPVEIPGSEFVLDVDAVVISIGTSPNPLIKATTKGLDTQKWGGIIADENGLTSREGVYAGGDAVTGAATVILAMGAGKTAAAAIDEYIQNKNK